MVVKFNRRLLSMHSGNYPKPLVIREMINWCDIHGFITHLNPSTVRGDTKELLDTVNNLRPTLQFTLESTDDKNSLSLLDMSINVQPEGTIFAHGIKDHQTPKCASDSIPRQYKRWIRQRKSWRIQPFLQKCLNEKKTTQLNPQHRILNTIENTDVEKSQTSRPSDTRMTFKLPTVSTNARPLSGKYRNAQGKPYGPKC